MWGGGGGGRGRQRPNYRGRTTRICVEKERPSYVLREIGRHPYKLKDGKYDGTEREEREGEGKSAGWVMELLLGDVGRGLLEKLRVELQCYR